jgi:hypothetical protein
MRESLDLDRDRMRGLAVTLVGGGRREGDGGNRMGEDVDRSLDGRETGSERIRGDGSQSAAQGSE